MKLYLDKSKCVFEETLSGGAFVVETDDVLLVCPRDEQKVKEMIAKIAMPQFEKFR